MSHHCEPIAPILSIKDYNELINAEQPGLLDWKGFPTSFDSEAEKSTDRKYFHCFFSKEHRFINFQMFHLKVDYVTCLKWLHYHLQNYTMMNENHLLLNYMESMSIWKKLSITNQSGSNVLAVGRQEDFVFEELQSEYSIISRNLTIRNCEGNIEIVVYDG
jgi:hypothetical protein